jgi:hypothetical protein
MYHLEIRQFPHNVCRFNLSEPQLRAVLVPWAREQVVEIGERKWSPHTAKLTVLEGPQLGMDKLAMGRGWRNAQRASDDVTQRVLADAESAVESPHVVESPHASEPSRAAASVSSIPAHAAAPHGSGTFEAQLASLLGPDSATLLEAWLSAAASSPGLAPSESLALAEHRLKAPDAGIG